MTLREHFIRPGDHLVHVNIVQDPDYLEEPLVKTTTHRLNPNAGPGAYQGWLFCQADDEVPGDVESPPEDSRTMARGYLSQGRAPQRRRQDRHRS